MRNRLADEQGFTLIELLVVILIIGILAAIALPNFLGQRAKGQDASAKTNVRNAVSHIESCFTDTSSYIPCTNTKLAASNTGLTFGTGQGQVSIGTRSSDGYAVTSRSASDNTFTITKSGGTTTRSCIVASGGDAGGCNGGSW